MTRDTLMMLAQIQKGLRNCAERDHNDIIANAASDLAVRLEAVNTTFGMRLKDLMIYTTLLQSSQHWRKTNGLEI
jgi:hypothetical protein